MAQSVLFFHIRHRLGFFSYFVGLFFVVGWEHWVDVIVVVIVVVAEVEVVVILAVMVDVVVMVVGVDVVVNP